MATCLITFGLTASGSAAQLISNGGFEDGGGSFSSWTVLDQSGGSGSWFIQTGTGSPLNGIPVPAPPGPTHAAMTDQGGPGSHVLYQDFVVPGSVSSATLAFELYIQNLAGDYATPDSLDFTVGPNQQARVDIITTTADPFSVAGGDVLQNIYQTQVGDPAEFGYVPIVADLTALFQANLGQTLRLRFAEVDDLNNFLMGIDQASLEVTGQAAVPEPATFVAAGLGGLICVAFARRRGARSAVR